MNKLLNIAVASVLGAALLSPVALAVEGNEITTTGPGSNNVIKERNDSKCEVNNNNNVEVDNNSDQDSTSGDADNKGNTSGGGGASSGNAGNSNQTETNVGVDNAGCEPGKGAGHKAEGDKDHAEAAPVATKDSGNAPGAGGHGAGFAYLPDTAAASPAAFVGIAALALGAAALLSRFAVFAYARFKA